MNCFEGEFDRIYHTTITAKERRFVEYPNHPVFSRTHHKLMTRTWIRGYSGLYCFSYQDKEGQSSNRLPVWKILTPRTDGHDFNVRFSMPSLLAELCRVYKPSRFPWWRVHTVIFLLVGLVKKLACQLLERQNLAKKSLPRYKKVELFCSCTILVKPQKTSKTSER